MAKKLSPSKALFNSLSPRAQHLIIQRQTAQSQPDPELPKTTDLGTKTEDHHEFAAASVKLSDRARAAQYLHEEVVGEEALDEVEGSYCLVEIPNGEIPVIRKFKSPEAMAKRIQQHEGEDIFAIAFFGHYLQYSVGPIRHLFLVDGESIVIKPHGGLSRANVFETEVTLQENNYLGPAEFIADVFDATPFQEDDEVFDDDDDDDEFDEELEV